MKRQITNKDKLAGIGLIVILVVNFIRDNAVDITLIIGLMCTLYFIAVVCIGKWLFKKRNYQLPPTAPSGGVRLIAIIFIILLSFQIIKIHNNRDYYQEQYEVSISNGIIKSVPIIYAIIKPINFIKDILIQNLLENLSNINTK